MTHHALLPRFLLTVGPGLRRHAHRELVKRSAGHHSQLGRQRRRVGSGRHLHHVKPAMHSDA